MILAYICSTIAIFLRYILFSKLFEYLIEKFLKERRIDLRAIPKERRNSEIYYAFLSSIIFGFFFLLFFYLWEKNDFIVLTSWSLSEVFKVTFYFIFHDMYYYFLHRLMHHKMFYSKVHQVHHASITNSVWTAFSFHPLETILQAAPFFLWIYFIPLHFSSLILILLIMTFSATYNHLNHSIIDEKENSLFIGPLHHTLHHKLFKKNYALYFTYLDRVFGTNS